MKRVIEKRESRIRRHTRIKNNIVPSSERPRLAVFRSAKHIYAQIVDDSTGRTLTCCSSLSAEFKAEAGYGGNVAAAKSVGKLVAAKALAIGVTKVAFDRGGFKYHGRIKALADSAREAGLDF